jgi:hypothetical protein
VKDIADVLLKIRTQLSRTSAHPLSNPHPGWMHWTLPSVLHTSSISLMSRLSNAR